MAVNKYFDNLYNKNEQELFTDIVQESIQIYGVDVIYIARDLEDFDSLLREEKLSSFRTTYTIDAYSLNAGQNTDMQVYMSKFGYRFEENTEIVISAKSWDELNSGIVQPRQGDYVYIGDPNNQYSSFMNCMFEIKQVVDGYPDTFQFGATAAYKLSLSLATKSYNRVVDTNYTDINEFLNPTTQSENIATIKESADDFTDVNIVPAGNVFTKWGMK